MTTKIESLTDIDHDFFINKYWNGLNAGAFIIRKSDWSEKWLRFIYEGESQYRNDCWAEQRRMQDNENNPLFKDRIKILPFPGINTLMFDLYGGNPNEGEWKGREGNFKKGDFLLHLAGMNFGQRVDAVNSQRIKDAIIYG